MDEKPKNGVPATEVHELAGLVDRVAAYFIDSILILIPLVLVAAILMHGGNDVPGQLAQFVSLAVPVAYHWYFWTRRDGQTPGKFALGIRVVKADGTPMSDTDALIRAIGYNVSAMLFGLGFLWAFFDRNKQSWHDKMARTYVVRNGRQRRTVDIRS